LAHLINITSADEKPACSIQFHSFPVFLGFVMVYCEAEFESSGSKEFPWLLEPCEQEVYQRSVYLFAPDDRF
jgi:hypothetical protein